VEGTASPRQRGGSEQEAAGDARSEAVHLARVDGDVGPASIATVKLGVVVAHGERGGEHENEIFVLIRERRPRKERRDR